MSNALPRQKRHQIAAGHVLARLIRLVASTSRVNAEPADYHGAFRAHEPCIYAMWHGQFMLGPIVRPADMPLKIMVARHGDAEALGIAMAQFGIELIRGAGAGNRGRDRGGAQALRQSLRSLADGVGVALTADVPPGPARVVGEGIITLARMSGRPIIPYAVATSRFKSFDTWSRMTINLPWSTIGVAVGEPIHVARDADAATLERHRQQLEQAMGQMFRRAYELAGVDSRPADPLIPLARAMRPGLLLKGYRAATHALRPAAGMILSRRARQGKEDTTRRNERFGDAHLPRPQGRLVWFHAASVGETNAVLPLLERLAQRRPDLAFLLTTGTVTSAQLAARRLAEGPAAGRALHQFVPLDAPPYVARFLEHWQPDLAIFAESEIWPNLILETHARDIPLMLVNARMSKLSFRKWKRRRSIARPLFGRFNLVLAQNDTFADRFAKLGAAQSRTVGNLKIDAPAPAVDPVALRELATALGGRPVLLAASTHPGEEVLVLEALSKLRGQIPDAIGIIVPRHPNRANALVAELSAGGAKLSRRSKGELPRPGDDIYLADTMGELGTLYALSQAAFVGGSLVEHGGQNPIEAVRHDCAVLTGPHWHNFADIFRALIDAKAAIEVTSPDELADAAARLLREPEQLANQRAQATVVINAMSGALDRTLDAIEALMAPQSQPDDAELQRAS